MNGSPQQPAVRPSAAPQHIGRKHWTAGPRALCALEMLAQVGNAEHAVHERTLHMGIHAMRQFGVAATSMALVRRDVLAVLHERGYIEPGPEHRTWRLSSDARPLLPRLRAGERCPAMLPATRRTWAGSAADDDIDDIDNADTTPPTPPTQAAEPPNPLLSAAVCCGMERRALSHADAHPCTARAGSEQALAYPSRRGNRLYWRDGRVTDLQGVALEVCGGVESRHAAGRRSDLWASDHR